MKAHPLFPALRFLRPEVVEAVQIAADLVTQMPGWLSAAISEGWLQADADGAISYWTHAGMRRAWIGDWLIIDEDGTVSSRTADEFAGAFSAIGNQPPRQAETEAA